jgi:hypothetical protein
MTDIEHRLANWGRAMRLSHIPQRCRSFEGNYRSPQRNHWEIPVSSLRGSVDGKDAWKIEVAWGSLPHFDRILLRAHYCFKWSPQHISRTAQRDTGIPCRAHQLPQMLEHARGLLEFALQRTEYQNRNILRTTVKKVLALVFHRGYSEPGFNNFEAR